MPATFRSSLCALLLLLASASFAQAPDSAPPDTIEDKPKVLQAQDVFWEVARKHPELEAHMRAGRREEALAYVQGLPESSEVHFARAFLLTGLRRYPQAREEAEKVSEGPEREMLDQLLVLYAMMESRAETIDAALEAATEALEANPDSREAMLKKSRLLREKAPLMDDGPERDAVLEEAGRLVKRAGGAALAQTPAPAGPPYRVEGDVKRPEKISGAPPGFTEEARKARVAGGVVILETLIDEKGNVTDVKVLQGLPMGLEEAAVKAVKSWKFKPATLHGQPVPVYYILTVNFTSSADGPTLGPLLSRFVEENRDFGGLVARKLHQGAGLEP